MFKVGDMVRCLQNVDDLRKGYYYKVVTVWQGRVTVKSETCKNSQLLTHAVNRFAGKLEFNVTYTQLPAQTVDCFVTFDCFEKSVVLKGTGFKDVYNLFHNGKSLGLVCGTTMQSLQDQVESKIYK